MNCNCNSKDYADFQHAEYDQQKNQILYGINKNMKALGVSDGTCNQINPVIYNNKYKCGFGVAGGNPCLNNKVLNNKVLNNKVLDNKVLDNKVLDKNNRVSNNNEKFETFNKSGYNMTNYINFILILLLVYLFYVMLF
jgi:hypothetical protein